MPKARTTQETGWPASVHGLAEALADLPQGHGQGDLDGHVGDVRNVAGDLVQRSIADDVIGADAQHLSLAEAAKDAQHGRVLVGRIDLGLQLRLQFRLTGAAAQRHAQHVEIIGIETEQIAERLAGAEQVQKDFQHAGAILQQDGELLDGGGVGEEAFEVVQRHVRIGTARQQPAQRRTEVAQAVERQRVGQAGQIAPAAFGIAQVPGVQQRRARR